MLASIITNKKLNENDREKQHTRHAAESRK